VHKTFLFQLINSVTFLLKKKKIIFEAANLNYHLPFLDSIYYPGLSNYWADRKILYGNYYQNKLLQSKTLADIVRVGSTQPVYKRLHRPVCKKHAELRESTRQLSLVGLVCTTGHQARTLRAKEHSLASRCKHERVQVPLSRKFEASLFLFFTMSFMKELGLSLDMIKIKVGQLEVYIIRNMTIINVGLKEN